MSYRVDKQVIDTHTLTDKQAGAMTIPEGENWPRVKIQAILSMRSMANAQKPQIWAISLSQNSTKIGKINRPWL